MYTHIEGVDFIGPEPSVLTFTSGQSQGDIQCANVTVLDDSVIEGESNFTIGLFDLGDESDNDSAGTGGEGEGGRGRGVEVDASISKINIDIAVDISDSKFAVIGYVTRYLVSYYYTA